METEIIKVLGSGGALTALVTICFKIISKLYTDIRTDRIELMNFLKEQSIINTKVSLSLERITTEVCDIKNNMRNGDQKL